MKSVILSKIARPADVERELNSLLPGQSHPWLLLSVEGDPVAYIDIEADGTIQADISGRHFNSEAVVLNVIERLRSFVGGELSVEP